jgi:RNA polymerase sigma-70 factor, ECF subfamily
MPSRRDSPAERHIARTCLVVKGDRYRHSPESSMDPHTPAVSPTDRRVRATWLADAEFLTGQAQRIVRSRAEAEDVVQEAFGRLARSDVDAIDDLRGWLTVVVRRAALDRLRSAYVRREVTGEPDDEVTSPRDLADGADPADRVTLDDQVTRALGVVLERLTPAERTAFVLHDVFDFPFDAVAEIVGRSPGACRQLASRARHSIRSEAPRPLPVEGAAVSDVAERFAAACAGGDMQALLAVLDPDVDGIAALLGVGPIVVSRGPAEVAQRAMALFGPDSRRTLVAVPVEGGPGLVAFEGDRVVAVIKVGERAGRVHHLEAFVRRPRNG